MNINIFNQQQQKINIIMVKSLRQKANTNINVINFIMNFIYTFILLTRISFTQKKINNMFFLC